MNDITDEVASLEDETSAGRHDHQPENVAPRGRKKRVAKTRHDSPPGAQVFGRVAPFKVELKPGWVAFWPTARELGEMSYRPWTAAKWGDPRIVSYQGPTLREKGEQIKYKEHSLYLMSAVNAEALNAGDPQRMNHQVLRRALFKKAESSEAGGMRGFAREHQLTVG